MIISQVVRTIFLSLMLASSAGAVSAAVDVPITLTECIATAIRDNRTIKNAYLDRVAQKYDLLVAEDKFTPKLLLSPSVQAIGGNDAATSAMSSLTGTFSEQLPTGASINLNARHDLNNSVNASPGRAYGWGVSLIQPLLKGAGIDVNMASVRTARLTEQGNILSLKTTIMDTLVTVVTAYRSYFQAIKQLEISRQSLARSKELVVTNGELISAGRMAAIDNVQAEANVATNEFNQLSAENAVDAARLALTKAIDIDKNSRIIPVEEQGIPPVPFTLEQANKLALENRPDYQSSLLGYENAKIQLLTSKNFTLWDLSLTGDYAENYTRDGAPGGNSFLGAWSAGLKLTMPIGDLSIRQAYIRDGIALKKIENNLARQEEDIKIAVQDDLRRADMNLRQIKLATQSRVLTEKKVEIETEKLKAGRSSNFQMISFQTDLVNSQNNELSAIITYLNALTTLERTLGITLDRWGVSLAERKQ
jgi:outer membrane protein TolC